MKVSNIESKLKHYISIMVICGSYMFEFNGSRNMEKRKRKSNNNDKRRMPSYLLAYLLTRIVKELKFSVEQNNMITTLYIIKH